MPKQKKARLNDAMLEKWWSGAWLLWVVLPLSKATGDPFLTCILWNPSLSNVNALCWVGICEKVRVPHNLWTLFCFWSMINGRTSANCTQPQINLSAHTGAAPPKRPDISPCLSTRNAETAIYRGSKTLIVVGYIIISTLITFQV